MLRPLILLLAVLVYGCSPGAEATPTTTSTTADPALEAAIERARASLPTFLMKLAAPHPDRAFAALKVRFLPPGEPSQDIWVDEVAYEKDRLRGSVGDDIPSLKLEAGDRITVPEDKILDWMIVEDGKLIGGYTIRLAVKRMSPEERARFLATLDYAIED